MIIIITKSSKLLFHDDVFNLPIKDAEVISGSIEFFNDPEPCMIHRSAVISRYYIQICNWLDGIHYANDKSIEFEDIPINIRKLLDF